MDKDKAIAILKWLIFDTTPMEPQDADVMGAALIFLTTQLEPLYDKYTKETSNVNDNQTGDQPRE